VFQSSTLTIETICWARTSRQSWGTCVFFNSVFFHRCGNDGGFDEVFAVRHVDAAFALLRSLNARSVRRAANPARSLSAIEAG